MKGYKLAVLTTLILALLCSCGQTASPFGGSGQTESPGSSPAAEGSSLGVFDESKGLDPSALPDKMQHAGEIALALTTAGWEEMMGKPSLTPDEAAHFYFAVLGSTPDDERAIDALENAYPGDIDDMAARMLGLEESRDYGGLPQSPEDARDPYWFYLGEDGAVKQANATDLLCCYITQYGGSEDEKSQEPYTITVAASYPAAPDESVAFLSTWQFQNVEGSICVTGVEILE